MTTTVEQQLRNYLNLYWLRPENGLLCTFKSRAFQDIQMASPSLDISCGDGAFMFLHLGGEFEDNFDYFRSTRCEALSHASFVDASAMECRDRGGGRTSKDD